MATGKTLAIQKAALLKQSETCAKRLVPRLARYLGWDSNAGKQRVRKILTDFGYAGPGWSDEPRAIAACEAAGHDMSKFERTQAEPAKAVVEEVRERRVEVVHPTDSAVEKLKNVTIILMQAEREIVREIKDGKRKSLGGLAVTVGAALDEIRR